MERVAGTNRSGVSFNPKREKTRFPGRNQEGRVFPTVSPIDLSLPLHPGARRYFERDEPTFTERYAELFSVAFSVVLGVDVVSCRSVVEVVPCRSVVPVVGREVDVSWWPVVAFGRLVNVVPFTTIRVLARTQALNFQATLKILVGVFLYPLWWLTLGLVVGALVTPLTGVAAFVAAPLLGYLAGERATHLRRLTNRLSLGDLAASTEPSTRELFAARDRVLEALTRVLDAA